MQKIREVLSANHETFVTIGSLNDDLGLRTSVKRPYLETDVTNMWSLVRAPSRSAMSEAKISAADLYSVVPLGVASRTP